MAQGSVDSGAMKDLGKPGAGESHARFDEGRLETGSGLGSAAPVQVWPGQRRTTTTTAPASYSTGVRPVNGVPDTTAIVQPGRIVAAQCVLQSS
jgi:hypothetical protein